MENALFDVFGFGNDRPTTIAGSTGDELLPGTIDIIPGGQGAIALQMQGSNLLSNFEIGLIENTDSGGSPQVRDGQDVLTGDSRLGTSQTLNFRVANNGEVDNILDVDGNGVAGGLSDGILVARYLLGLTGDALISGAIDPDGDRTDAGEIVSYLDGIGDRLDVDGNGVASGRSDGVVMIRYLLGLRGDALISGAVDLEEGTRTTPEAIEGYVVESLVNPPVTPEPETMPVVEVSPANGSEMVNLTRETVVRFGEKVDPATVNDESFFLIANGERVAGRIVVSSTEEFATFFYDESLPASTEVRVVVEGDAIIGRDGDAIDADGDGNAGGTLTADFRTLPLTRIEGTDVSGFVFDSFNTNADGSNIPVVGATIRVDAFPEANAITDENGFFLLSDVPAPVFSVHIDGSTADNAPEGTVYATVGKLFESVPGQETQLSMDGETFDIFLPPMATGDIQELSPTEDTNVGFGNAGVAQLEALFPEVDAGVWERTRVTFPAGSAQDEEGNVATQAAIIPVAPDRLPAPLPPGIELPLVISIQAGGDAGFSQAGGATNFDVPAPVSFPNLDGLAPGEQSLIWSFNHDSGDWEVVGTGTVSDDGLSVDSDPGVGILAPGWHGTAPGTQHEEMAERDDCEDASESGTEAFRQSGATILSGLSALIGTVDLIPFGALGTMIGATGGTVAGPGGTVAGGLTGQQVGAIIDSLLTGSSVLLGAGADIVSSGMISGTTAAQASIAFTTTTAGFIPGVGWGATVPADIVSWQLGIDSLASQLSRAGNAIGNFAEDLFNCASSAIEKAREDLESEFNELADRFSETAADIIEIINQAEKAIRYVYELGEIIQGKRPIPSPIPQVGFQSLDVALQNSPFNEDELPSEAELVQILEDSLNQALEAVAFFESINVSTIGEAFERQRSEIVNLQQDFIDAISPAIAPASGVFYTVETAQEVVVATGITNQSGSWNTVLSPNETLRVSYYDPATGSSWQDFIRTNTSGSSSQATRVIVDQSSEDTDGDGLPDVGETAVGTAFDNPDTDGDGINDLAEIQQGLDPLGGRAFPTGVISSLPLRGEARDIVVEGSPLDAQDQTAYVATGFHGLAIVDASQFDNPIVLGQLDLPGDNIDVAVDANLEIAAVAGQNGGLHLVDVSDPMLPTVIQTLSFGANQVDVADGIVYATSGTALQTYDLLTGEQIEGVRLADEADDLTVFRDKAYVLTESQLEIFDNTTTGLERLSSIGVSGSPAPLEIGRRLFVDGELAYVGYFTGYSVIDVSDPEAPVIVGQPPATQAAVHDLVANGSGLVLPVTSFAGRSTLALSLYDGSDPTDVTQFITSIDTPGDARAVAVASGIAYVADGSGGLAVINYLPFDSQGVAPTVTIGTSADVDPNTSGIQVVEGSSISITADVVDDVQVRNVELLINGEVVGNDVSFPFDLSAIAPNIVAGADTVDIQVQATDTGGNGTLSNVLTLDLVEDTFAPVVVGTTPDVNGTGASVSSITIRFDEELDTSLVNLSGLTLTNLGTDGVLGGGDDTTVTLETVETPSERRLVIFSESILEEGSYQLAIDPSIIADRAGNFLESPFTLEFDSLDVPPDTVIWLSGTDGDWENPGNWSSGEVPGVDDNVVINLLRTDATITISSNVTVESLQSEESVILANGSLTVNGPSSINGDFTINSAVTANGPEASLVANGAVAIDAANLFARDGGLLDFSSVTSYAGSNSNFSDRFIQASGAGSRIELPNLTTLTGGTAQGSEVFINALEGGTIDLSELTEIDGGATQVLAEGTGSILDLSSLTSFNANSIPSASSRMEARSEGAITADNLTSMERVNLVFDGSGTLTVSQLANIDDSNILVSNGGTLALPEVASYAGSNSNFSDRFIQASGAGSRIELPNLTTLTGGTAQGSEVFINALEGGTIDLSELTEIDGGATQVLADGSGSVVDIASLLTGDNFLQTEERNGGTIVRS